MGSNYWFKRKRKELEELERKIKLKRFEYEKLERTSGARSKITWACIDIQKFNSEKITEIINILGIIDVESRKKAYPALKQLHIHLESFSENIKSYKRIRNNFYKIKNGG